MPPARASDRVAVLRAAIQKIETGPIAGQEPAGIVSSGHHALDRFLGGGLARGAVHDIHAVAAGDSGAAIGFALAWAARAARGASRPIVWISTDDSRGENGVPYGPGLAAHGVDPTRLILVRATTVQDALWALEEGLRARAPAAVMGDFVGLPNAYDLTASRRLLLAAQTGRGLGLLAFSGVGGSAIHAASAAATRFTIGARVSAAAYGAPERAVWRIDLIKNRAGRTGQFSVEWNHDDVAFAQPRPASSTTILRNRAPDLADRPFPSANSLRRAG